MTKESDANNHRISRVLTDMRHSMTKREYYQESSRLLRDRLLQEAASLQAELLEELSKQNQVSAKLLLRFLYNQDIDGLRAHLTQLGAASPKPRPPKAAEQLIYLCMPKGDRDCLIGDLEEEFMQILARGHGSGFAHRWYWIQVMRSLLPLVGAQLMRLFRWAWLSKAAEWLITKL